MIDLLKGMKVVEMANFVAGPTAGRVLGEWGAEVIKVEPITGDGSRGCGLARNILNGDTAAYEAFNACKKSIALDTRKPEGLAILKELLKQSDVFITHLRDKDARKLGLDYDSLKELNPGLICASTSGYGLTGPMAARGGFDAVSYAARCGFTVDTAAKGSLPLLTYFGYGDIPTGTYLAMAIMAAYIRKLRTGEGDQVISALMHCGMWTANIPIVTAAYGDKYPASLDTAFPMNRPYQCKDGEWIAVCGLTWEKNFADLIRVANLPQEYMEKWPDYMSAMRGAKELCPIIAEVFLREDRSYWEKVLDEQTDIPFDICQHFSDLQNDKQAWEAGFFYESEQRSGKKVGIVTAPAQFRNAGQAELYTEDAGADSREVLKRLGYTDEQIDEMRANKLIAEGDQWNPDMYNVLKYMNDKK